ncbi:MAG: YggT family protein [Clostridiales Family XIII bacterium]|jgi:YggT family protein|nr:YggT family protein [Clostridiales Family XIII bacterium]
MTIFLMQVINLFFQVIVYLILGRAIMSWFIRPGDRLYPLYMSVIRITEPILAPFRNLSNRIMGHSAIDFSPVLAILAIYIIRRLLSALLIGFML